MSEAARHIVALGGGGFLMEPKDRPLEDYVLSLARRTPARVCFVPTASGDAHTYLVKFYRAMSGRCIATDLTFFASAFVPRNPPHNDALAAFVAEQDVFYVGGGSTANLLAVWRAHGLDELLREAWSSGAVLAGVSAGMNCWFRASVTDSFGGLAGLLDGLGFLEGSACPHYDTELERRDTYHRLIAEGFPAGYAADDGVALHFAGDALAEVVSSRENASAYRVELQDGKVVESRLAARLLGQGLASTAAGSQL